MVEELLSRGDRRIHSLSQFELERRWKAVRERMADKKIDFLFINAQQRYVGGYIRWFTDMPAQNYQTNLVFPLKDEMTLVMSGAPSVTPGPKHPMAWSYRGVKETIIVTAFSNVYWSEGLYAEKAAEVMMKKKPKTVGLVGLGNMSAAAYENIKKNMPGVNFVNATALVDEVRMVKSEEELKLHRDAAVGHLLAHNLAKTVIKAGRDPYDIVCDLRFAQIKAGSEVEQISMIYGRPGSPYKPDLMTTGIPGVGRSRRPLQDGDIVNILIESSFTGGYWYDYRRCFSIGGPAPSEFQEAYGIVVESRAVMAANLKPGTRPAVALDANDKYLKSKKCPPEARVAGHGQGLDLLEMPMVHHGEPTKLQVGMVLSLHPTAKPEFGMMVSDTYVITNAGAVPIYPDLFHDNKITEVG